jgi:hypothetical protein
MTPFTEEGNDMLAILNPDSRFMLHPITTNEDGEYYQPDNGWLEVSVSAFDGEKQTIRFCVHNNTLPGVGLKKMMEVHGTFEDVATNFLRLEVHGLTFDRETPVEWISFEDFEASVT